MNFKEQFYIFLSAVFIASLVACNLIFQKFFMLDVHYTVFVLSVGILTYPVTFLVTDVISEIYGKKKADTLVFSGFIASVFIMVVVLIANAVPSTPWSPVNDDLFQKVFGLQGFAVFASMVAYLSAQFIDVRIFHFWKKLTKGKHLWLRNNGSTVVSQFVDTAAVLVLLCATGAIEWERFLPLLENGFLFKVLVALIDTPIIYAVIYALKGKIDIAHYDEV